ncbi:MAG: hypothetical protein AB1797_06330 [bacterium]
MQATLTIARITDTLLTLPAEKLAVVYDFVSYLSEREHRLASLEKDTGAIACMLASEAVLRRDWDRPEEDAAWANL